MNFDDIEPFTAIRDDLQFASIVSTLVNLRRNVEKFPEPFPLTDFLLLFGDKEERERQSKLIAAIKKTDPKLTKAKDWRELKAMGQFLAALYNAAEDSENEKKEKRRRRKG
jgi:hypothetical protein